MTTITFEVSTQHTDELLALLQRWNGAAPVTTEVSSTAPFDFGARAERPPSLLPAVTLEALRQALTKISQDGKAAQIKTLLAEFGARNVKELKAADFAAVLEKAGKL